MKRDARAGEFSHLAVYRVDRLGRNTLEGLIAFQEFIELGVEVKTASSPDINPVTPDGKFFMGMQMLMAQHETEVMRQRMSDSKRAILHKGGWPFNAPDGYLNKREAVGNGKFRTWIEVDPPRFEMWRLAFDLVLADHLTLNQICIELHKQGHMRRTGKPWAEKNAKGEWKGADNKLSRGLSNPFYAGRVVSDHYGILYEDGIEGEWTPMISIEEYEQCRAILARRNQHRSHHHRYFYLLRDLLKLRVGRREYKMYLSSPTRRTKTYSYYSSRVKVDGAQINIPIEIVDRQIPDRLADIHIPRAAIPQLQALYREHISRLSGPNRAEQIEQMREQIRQLNTEESDLARLLLKKRISQKSYDKLRKEWREKLLHKQRELEQIEREMSVYLNDLDAAIRLLSEAPRLYERMQPRDQHRLLKLLMETIVIDRHGAIIEVQLNSPFAYLQDLRQDEEIAAKNSVDMLMLGFSSPTVRTQTHRHVSR